MIIPKQIKIGGLLWDVKDSKEVSNEGNCYGSTHHNLQKIFLDPQMSKQKREQVFLHELIHAAWENSGLGSNKTFNKESEEMVVHALGNGLYQILNDNKILK